MDIKIIATEDTFLILTSCTQIELTRDQAENLYEKLDKHLWSNTRAKLQKQKRDLELKEDLLKESMAFAEKCNGWDDQDDWD